MDLWPLPGIETRSVGHIDLTAVFSIWGPSKRPVLGKPAFEELTFEEFPLTNQH